jgi:hypothetical protein
MQQETPERVAQRYRDEGYQVVVRPFGEQIPPFIAGFQPDLIAIRGNEGVIVEIKINRMDLSRDHQISRLAEIVNARPGWRLDLVVLEPETTVEKAPQEAAEPSDEQLAQMGAVAPVPRISTKSGPFSRGEWLESPPGSARGY